MNHYSPPLCEDGTRTSLKAKNLEPAGSAVAQIVLPALLFPMAFLATAGIVQSLLEDVTSAADYVHSLVFDFPLMFSALVFGYAGLRTIFVLRSFRSPIWLCCLSAATAFLLFPQYFSAISQFIGPIGNDTLASGIMGFAPACFGIATECLVMVILLTLSTSQSFGNSDSAGGPLLTD